MSGEQIKPGYKRTEVGVIPKDWEVKRLCEISPGQSVGLVINPSTYFDIQGTVPMLVGSNVSENSIDWTGARRISFSSHRKLPASAIYENDLVTVRVGDPGITAVVPKEFDDSNCASMMIVKRHRSFDSNWLCHLMNSHLGRSQIEAIQYGTAQKQFNISDAVNFQYPTPSLNEQRTIATALSDVDALLAKLDQLIAKKRDLKQATMQQLLTGQTRLPGFSGEWEVKRLDALADIRSGGTPSTAEPQFWNGDVPWCTPSDITGLDGFKYFSQTARSITYAGLIASSAELLPIDSIVMTSRATIGECAINSVPMTTNQGFKNFIPFPSTDGEFLYYLLQTKKQEFIDLCSGSTFLEIGKTQLIRFEVRVPMRAEQTAIANVLFDLDAELAALEARRDKTRELKQGMMQELLTGQIRLL